MNNANGNEKVIRLMSDAIDEAMGLINKAISEIFADLHKKAVETLSLAQDKLEMENLNAINGKEYSIDDPVWCLIPQRGMIAGKISGICYNGHYIVSLIAGPNKFNEQVLADENMLKRRED